MRGPLIAAVVIGGGAVVIAGIAYAFLGKSAARGSITWTSIPPQSLLHKNLVYRFSDVALPSEQFTVAQMQQRFGSDFAVGDVKHSPPPSDWVNDGGTRLYVEFTVTRDGVSLPSGASSQARLYVSPPGFV